MYKVDNAIIMAAGVSSRFAPLSYEKPKALTVVRGEVLIERQIKQLRAAGIPEIYIVTGYKAEQFNYLQEKFNVRLIFNSEYMTRNNHSSIYAAKDVIRNSYICSADNYFLYNPFEPQVEESYYAALYASGDTNEWCMQTDADDYITRVEVGGHDSWYMLGHAFWSENFSAHFTSFLEEVYDLPQTNNLFWEDIFIDHLDTLKMKIRKYPGDFIFEFDSIDELRIFDKRYIEDTGSQILKDIARRLNGTEAEITHIRATKTTNTTVTGIQFVFRSEQYTYTYGEGIIKKPCNKSVVGKEIEW